MRERVLRIGKSSALIGIECIPENWDKQKPAVLLLNSGLMHHVGTSRFSVLLARKLAEIGIYSIRMDFSGIGDSQVRSGNKHFKEMMTNEVIECIDCLNQRNNMQSFICFGLCSGADASFYSALIDKRIIAICQIDPLAYKHWTWFIEHYRTRIFKLSVWRHFFSRMLKKHTSVTPLIEPSIDLGDGREVPKKHFIKQGLATLISRDVKMYIIITNGQSHLINLANQYYAIFPVLQKSQTKLDFLPHCSHVIAEPDQQIKLLNSIPEWIELVSKNSAAT